MSAPETLPPVDFSTPEGIAAYPRELRHVGRPLRFWGFMVVIVGAFLTFYDKGTPDAPDWLRWVALTFLLGGWGLLLVAIYQRYQYNRRRLRAPKEA